MAKRNMFLSEPILNNFFALNSAIDSSNAIIITGDIGGWKSTLWSVLRESREDIIESVVLFPQTLSQDLLFGTPDSDRRLGKIGILQV